jgi:hypothetical protein
MIVKPKKCIICKAKFTPFKTTQRVCSTKCALIFVGKDSKKKVKKQEKENRKEKRKYIEDNKSIKQLIAEAKKPYQKWIRFRDANQPCISCGSTTADIWDGGHFYKAELYTGMIFNENNVHKQCRKCNSFLGGNENNYRLGLIKRYGMDYVLELDAMAITARMYKFTKDEVRELKAKYLNKLKELK